MNTPGDYRSKKKRYNSTKFAKRYDNVSALCRADLIGFRYKFLKNNLDSDSDKVEKEVKRIEENLKKNNCIGIGEVGPVHYVPQVGKVLARTALGEFNALEEGEEDDAHLQVPPPTDDGGERRALAGRQPRPVAGRAPRTEEVTAAPRSCPSLLRPNLHSADSAVGCRVCRRWRRSPRRRARCRAWPRSRTPAAPAAASRAAGSRSPASSSATRACART